VPEEIKDEQFWQDFRRVVKRANPDAYIVGEIWHEAPDWLRGDRFDAVMNYILSRAALGFFAAETLRLDYKPGGFALAPMNATAFAKAIDTMLSLYDWQIIQAQLNLIDSHDTARTLWMVGGDESALRLCTLFQLTMPGAPCIYYGDEIGMTGGHDPLCRGAFPWHEQERWNHELLDFYRRAIALRHRYPALSMGGFKALYADHHLYAFRRDGEGQTVIVAFNAGHEAATLDLKVGAGLEGRRCTDVWLSGEYAVKRGKLARIQVPAREAVVLVG
jgi:neopullulanase